MSIDLRNYANGESTIDLDAIAQWLNCEAEWPGDVRVTGISIERLWQSGGGRLTFELRLALQDGDQTASALLQGGWGAPQFRSHHKARYKQRWITGLRLASTSLGVWVCSPDRDPRLGLRAYFDPKLHADAIVAYRLGKRCVVHRPHSADSECGCYMKFFAQRINIDRLRELNRASELLYARSNGFARTAPVVAVDRKARMIVTRDVGRATSQETTEFAVAMAARTACALHGTVCELSRAHSPMDEIETVRRWESAVARHEPDTHTTLGSLRAELTRFADNLPGASQTTIHRDFYADQLVVGEQGVWLLDIDTLCMGHREQDIATYCAHLLHEHRDKPQCGFICVQSLLNTYESEGASISEPHLQFYLSAATARITLIHALRDLRWDAMLRLWATARTILCAGVDAGLDRYVAGATEGR